MHGRDVNGAVASLTSVAKLPFAYAKDGISYTFSIIPGALGKDDASRQANLAGLMDGYFHHDSEFEGGQHLNVNVLNREMLIEADHPRLRLCGALQLAHQRAADGRHHPYLHPNHVSDPACDLEKVPGNRHFFRIQIQ